MAADSDLRVHHRRKHGHLCEDTSELLIPSGLLLFSGTQLLLLAHKGDGRLIKHFATVYLVMVGSLTVITTVYIRILPPMFSSLCDGSCSCFASYRWKRTTQQITAKRLKLEMQPTTPPPLALKL